jgi:MoxR-like ATPase
MTPSEPCARIFRARSLARPDLVERLLIALLADGHLLVEGAPGLAKTTAVKALATRSRPISQRVQFTPDLLPSDLTGTDMWRQAGRPLRVPAGADVPQSVLADEINRAPAKVQSALLEAMGERQVTVGRATYALPQLFLVMATQNPIEQEGTYPVARGAARPLPDARAGRLSRGRGRDRDPAPGARTGAARAARGAGRAARACRRPRCSPRARRCSICTSRPRWNATWSRLVLASRDARAYDATLARRIAWGASPRGSIALERCARARAWLAGRDFVTPEDVHAIAPDVLRHRVLPSYEATAEGWDGERLVSELLRLVPLP